MVVSTGGGTLTFVADSDLISLDPPALSNTVDREAFKIQFADPSLTWAGAADTLSGSKVSIWLGFFNTTGSNLLSAGGVLVEDQHPILDVRDCLTIYKGIVDDVSYNLSEESGGVLDITCASPMASLDALNAFYTTHDSLYQRTAGPDTCFDNVLLGGSSQEILWGKI